MDRQLYLPLSTPIPPQEERKSFIENNAEEIPLTFRDFEKKYGWPTERSLRKLAFERETNGLEPAFVKFKKRILVLPQTLFRLIRGETVKPKKSESKSNAFGTYPEGE